MVFQMPIAHFYTKDMGGKYQYIVLYKRHLFLLCTRDKETNCSVSRS